MKKTRTLLDYGSASQLFRKNGSDNVSVDFIVEMEGYVKGLHWDKKIEGSAQKFYFCDASLYFCFSIFNPRP